MLEPEEDKRLCGDDDFLRQVTATAAAAAGVLLVSGMGVLDIT